MCVYKLHGKLSYLGMSTLCTIQTAVLLPKGKFYNLFPLLFILLDIYNFTCTMIASSALQSSPIYKNAGIEQVPGKYKSNWA